MSKIFHMSNWDFHAYDGSAVKVLWHHSKAPPPWTCEHCRMTEETSMRPSMTCYPLEGTVGSRDDPNRERALCDSCWAEHEAHWKDAWAEYYGSVL